MTDFAEIITSDPFQGPNCDCGECTEYLVAKVVVWGLITHPKPPKRRCRRNGVAFRRAARYGPFNAPSPCHPTFFGRVTMETIVELVLGTKEVRCQVYGRFERSTYLAMSQDPVVPLSVSTPTPQDATLANKNVTSFFAGFSYGSF
jgi:hypothetical protein